MTLRAPTRGERRRGLLSAGDGRSHAHTLGLAPGHGQRGRQFDGPVTAAPVGGRAADGGAKFAPPCDLGLRAVGLAAPGGRHDGACTLQAPSTAPEIFRLRYGAGNFPPPSGQDSRQPECRLSRWWQFATTVAPGPLGIPAGVGACDGGAKLAPPCDLGFRPPFPVVVNHDHRASRGSRAPQRGRYGGADSVPLLVARRGACQRRSPCG